MSLFSFASHDFLVGVCVTGTFVVLSIILHLQCWSVKCSCN